MAEWIAQERGLRFLSLWEWTLQNELVNHLFFHVVSGSFLLTGPKPIATIKFF